MWVPKRYLEYASTKQNELERRVKRLELILLLDAENKIASLSDEEAGTVYKDGTLAIEKVIKRKSGKESN